MIIYTLLRTVIITIIEVYLPQSITIIHYLLFCLEYILLHQ